MEQVPIDFQNKWFRFGLALFFLYALFTLLVIGLLRIDQQLALIAAVGLSIVGAIALVVFVQFYFRHW